MPTGYEARAYQDLSRAAIALESIAKSLALIANPPDPRPRAKVVDLPDAEIVGWRSAA